MIDTQEDIHQFVKFATNVFDVEYDMQDPKGVALEGVKRFRAWLKGNRDAADLQGTGREKRRYAKAA